MGIATFLIAFVPTYQSIGIWGAVILTVLRMIQGIGVGGEWGGSVLLAMEWARHHGQRGLVASWPQFGVPAGLFLSNLVILAFSAWSGDQFATWGWRIPFARFPSYLSASDCGSGSASSRRRYFGNF
jgi:MFS family permease